MVESVDLRGLSRTQESTILELLARPPPTVITDAEVLELERRINNLAIFDSVAVERKGRRLEVRVREKWTLIPNVEFSSGQTVADTYAMLGATEFNFLGRATQARVSAFREQRGWGGAIEVLEHPFRRRRWALQGGAGFSTAGYRFPDGSGWMVARPEIELGATSLPFLSQHVNYRAGFYYGYESVFDRHGPSAAPSPGHTLAVFSGFVVDNYLWRDLVPSGVRAEIMSLVGARTGDARAQPRHSAQVVLTGAVPIAKYTVATARLAGGATTRGNANFSLLLGSVEGVRGLEDGYYRNWLQAYTNVELRQGLPIAKRWALQGVLFADAAIFEGLSASGGRGEHATALAVGGGARVIPTWLASVVPRVDVSRLLAPRTAWFVQLGLNQYF
ncbi:MAG: hypothetical protein K0S65_3932 [Labilithrix sp.]|nr:hypothetical protein [Labilithrix sp.]